MAKPLVTVIVAVYNIENYIARCVESILAQTYEHLEILLVDDGSTDDSGRLCDEYAKKDERIRVIHKENGGLSDARNAGLKEAAGDYVGYVDGDDWIEPFMYEALVEACETKKAQIGVCRYSQYLESLGEDGATSYEPQPMDEEKPSGEVIVYSADEALESFIGSGRKYKIHNCVWSKLFRRELAVRYPFPVGKNSEDILYTTKTFCDADRVAFVDRECYNYVVGRAGSIMNVGLYERRLKHEIPFWVEQAAYLREKGKEELADKSSFYFYKRLMNYYREAYGEKKYALQLAGVMKLDKANAKRILKHSWVAKGDRSRMKLFLFSPGLYEWTCRLYDKLVVPMKRSLKKG